MKLSTIRTACFLVYIEREKVRGNISSRLSPKRAKELLRRKQQTHWLKVDQVSISEPIPVARGMPCSESHVLGWGSGIVKGAGISTFGLNDSRPIPGTRGHLQSY